METINENVDDIDKHYFDFIDACTRFIKKVEAEVAAADGHCDSDEEIRSQKIRESLIFRADAIRRSCRQFTDY